MVELGVLCTCKWCKSNAGAIFDNGEPVEADHYNSISLYHKERCKYLILNGVSYPLDRVVHTGGRRAIWIFLEPGEEVFILSSRGRDFSTGKTIDEIKKEYEIIKEYEASVHGCSKIQCHQTMLIARKKSDK
jgi:hypothetical protein